MDLQVHRSHNLSNISREHFVTWVGMSPINSFNHTENISCMHQIVQQRVFTLGGASLKQTDVCQFNEHLSQITFSFQTTYEGSNQQ